MTMGPALRKVALTAHVISSVGWMGSVGAFLSLAIAGLLSENTTVVRSSYIAMELIGRYIIVPLSFATLATGLIQSLGTAWGLFRHYWVLFKLLIAVLATGLLLLHMEPVAMVSRAALMSALSGNELRPVRIQLLADAAAAILILVVATVLSIYKPRGVTAYGWRKIAGAQND